MNAVLSAILPVFLIASTGYLLRRTLPLHLKTLTLLNIYVLIPALVFGQLSSREIDWALFGRIAGAAVLMVVAMGALLTWIARLRRMDARLQSAFRMTMFANLGNFGLPVAMFAFGEEGLALAVIVMVCGGFLQNSVGVYFAQRGRHSVLRALGSVFQFPMIYAFALALLVQQFNWRPPLPIDRAVAIVADGAIPIQLLIVGATLAETSLEIDTNVLLASAMRLCAAPVVAALVVLLLGIEGLAAKVFILQMSGPVAIGMAVYGIQFDLEPGFLASAVSLTFGLSLVSVSVVLSALYAVAL